MFGAAAEGIEEVVEVVVDQVEVAGAPERFFRLEQVHRRRVEGARPEP